MDWSIFGRRTLRYWSQNTTVSGRRTLRYCPSCRLSFPQIGTEIFPWFLHHSQMARQEGAEGKPSATPTAGDMLAGDFGASQRTLILRAHCSHTSKGGFP